MGKKTIDARSGVEVNGWILTESIGRINKQPRWIVRCVLCSRTRNFNLYALNVGNVGKCICVGGRNIYNKYEKRVTLSGLKVNGWTVVDVDTGVAISKRYWLCRCDDCGRENLFWGNSLLSYFNNKDIRASVKACDHIEDGFKKCPKCTKTKPLNEFYKRKDRTDESVLSACMECSRRHSRGFLAKKLSDPSFKVWSFRSGAKSRARKSGVSFDVEAFEELSKNPPVSCPVIGCGRKIDYSSGKGIQMDDSPSIDRVFPAKGYVKLNIRVICWRCNDVKGNATHEELEIARRDTRLMQFAVLKCMEAEKQHMSA